MESPTIKRALISVSDKAGIVELAKTLAAGGVEIVSTGGTRRHLENEGVAVTDVADYTQFPEMMDGRVKTLHPKIFAGVLCRHDLSSDMDVSSEHGIVPFELVVVNLYPFAQTIAKPETTQSEAVEQIDIGGPSLIRAAAKNHQFVTVACDPAQYESLVQEFKESQCTSLQTRQKFMADAFAHTAEYDTTIAEYFSSMGSGSGSDDSSSDSKTEFPATLNLPLKKQAVLRYGENSHMRAALYAKAGSHAANLIQAEQHNGKQLSYNNLLDLDSALAMVRGLDRPACSVIKHNNPCGAACAESLSAACEKGFAGDPVSAFGSVVGFNRNVDAATAESMCGSDKFVEAIVAPGFDAEALEVLTTKPKWKKNVRLLSVGELGDQQPAWEYRNLLGGMLVQDADNAVEDEDAWTVATGETLDEETMRELRFGWHMVRYVKSNAITLSKGEALVGVGAGQMSRVDSTEIAILKAGDRAGGSFLASDAFFPFADSIESAASAGIRAIIQPGGSVRDPEVIEACKKHEIPLVLTGRRHFRH